MVRFRPARGGVVNEDKEITPRSKKIVLPLHQRLQLIRARDKDYHRYCYLIEWKDINSMSHQNLSI